MIPNRLGGLIQCEASVMVNSICLLLVILSWKSIGAPIPAKHKQGSLHGYLLLKSGDGKVLAVGDQVNVIHGDQIRSRLVFHFRDGSIDDESTTFQQGTSFQLVRHHHLQRGPSFPDPLDMAVDVHPGRSRGGR